MRIDQTTIGRPRITGLESGPDPDTIAARARKIREDRERAIAGRLCAECLTTTTPTKPTRTCPACRRALCRTCFNLRWDRCSTCRQDFVEMD